MKLQLNAYKRIKKKIIYYVNTNKMRLVNIWRFIRRRCCCFLCMYWDVRMCGIKRNTWICLRMLMPSFLPKYARKHSIAYSFHKLWNNFNFKFLPPLKTILLFNGKPLKCYAFISTAMIAHSLYGPVWRWNETKFKIVQNKVCLSWKRLLTRSENFQMWIIRRFHCWYL